MTSIILEELVLFPAGSVRRFSPSLVLCFSWSSSVTWTARGLESQQLALSQALAPPGTSLFAWLLVLALDTLPFWHSALYLFLILDQIVSSIILASCADPYRRSSGPGFSWLLILIMGLLGKSLIFGSLGRWISMDWMLRRYHCLCLAGYLGLMVYRSNPSKSVGYRRFESVDAQLARGISWEHQFLDCSRKVVCGLCWSRATV